MTTNLESKNKSDEKPRRSGASLVASGILLSRLAGFARDRALAYFLGNSDAADAFRSALRIPNFLQNLFGEGLLSASFIPVYSRLLAQERKAEAKTLALTVGVALSLMTGVMVLLGLLSSGWLLSLIAPGFTGPKRDLTLQLVQLFFPAIGILVLSAWCLGVLNSHRRFFLSYSAPVLWNLSIVGVLLCAEKFQALNWFPHWGPSVLDLPYSGYAWAAGWGLVLGSVLQFLVQLPSVLRLLGRDGSWRIALDQNAREVFRNFTPSLISRGVVQISAYIDNMLASLLASGAVSAISFAQTIYLVPVSLFGMSISAAELPEMSRLSGSGEDVKEKLRQRLSNSLNTMLFMIVPSSLACVVLSQVLVGGLYQTGSFTANDTKNVGLILSALGVGLLAASSARLVSSTFYALGDPRTPLKFALVRVSLGTLLGFSMSRYLPDVFGMSAQTGPFFLGLASAAGAWLEFVLLRQALLKRLQMKNLGTQNVFLLLRIAMLSALLTFAAMMALNHFAVLPSPFFQAAMLLPLFGLLYLLGTSYFQIPQSVIWIDRVKKLKSKLF